MGVAVSYDPSRSYLSVKFYLDHLVVDQYNHILCAIGYGVGPLTLGHHQYKNSQSQIYTGIEEKLENTSREWAGSLASLQMWKKCLTTEQIRLSCGRCSKVHSHPDILGFWKCDEGFGNVVHDSTVLGDRSVGNHGTVLLVSSNGKVQENVI